MLRQLVRIYGEPVSDASFVFERGDISNDTSLPKRIGKYSHVITSPPYLNAQDYFRNFKLELYVLENLMPFNLSELRYRLIGTERGDLLRGIPDAKSVAFQHKIPHLSVIQSKSKRLADVVIRYCYDMERAFDVIRECLKPGGSLVLVCGDNLIAGTRFPTWRVLQQMLETRGFVLVDSFTDEIKDRMLAPKRSGHKGIIKEEVVLAFRRP